MLTKRERFEQWRGDKAGSEQSILETALIVSNYVNSVENLATIKAEFSNNQSAQYIAFNRYGKSFFGIVLYCKLRIEEVLEQIPITRVAERALLNDLKNILAQIYDNPAQNVAQNVNNLITTTRKLLNLDLKLLDKKLVKALYFDFYILLNIVNIAAGELSWVQVRAANALIDLNNVKEEITALLQVAENKINQVDDYLEESIPSLGEEGDPSGASGTIQDYFNADFLALIKSDDSKNGEFILVEERMNEVIEGINHLISKRNKKEDIRLKIEKIEGLLKAVEENDKRIRNREYGLSLINANLEAFNILMDACEGPQKEQLIEKIKHLKNAQLHQNVPRTIGQVTSTVAYYAPQKLQDMVFSEALTLDRECKAGLKDLAHLGISTLTQECSVIDKEIAQLTQQLANGRIKLENLIAQESTANLILLVKANSAARDALQHYREISGFLTGMVWYLKVIKESTGALTQFVQMHDGFLVRLSNFLARIVLIFKSKTAVMIDEACEMKEHLARFELEYRHELTKELNIIVRNPDINEEIKARLQERIGMEMASEARIIPYASPNAVEVRHLVKSLEELFNRRSKSIEPDNSAFEAFFSPSVSR